jgi:hypothetical protein
MALQLPTANGSSYISGPFTAVTAYPFSIWCRAQTQSSTEDDCAFEMGGMAASDDMHGLWFRGDMVGDPMQLRRTGPVGGVGVNSVAGYAINTWCHLGGVAAADADGRLYANNVKSTSTTSVTFANGNVVIGAHFSLGAGASYLSGQVSHCAVWDVALTDDEFTSLFRGFSPRRIRPQNLKFYAPLVRQNIDIRGGISLTPNGSPTSADHPRSYGL